MTAPRIDAPLTPLRTSANRHKAARTQAHDAVTDEHVPLFHPAREVWEEHFGWGEGAALIVGRTAVGRATIEALQMNRPRMVLLRRYWAATGRHPPR